RFINKFNWTNQTKIAYFYNEFRNNVKTEISKVNKFNYFIKYVIIAIQTSNYLYE
ncbi:hypothetical protein GGTG_08241, partial [Gaeumannomyces tritici R3-111a-1]